MRNNLRALRAERGWTQADVAARVDVSRQTVNAIEVGKFDPSLPVAFRLARVFGLTIEDVFIEEGEKGEAEDAAGLATVFPRDENPTGNPAYQGWAYTS